MQYTIGQMKKTKVKMSLVAAVALIGMVYSPYSVSTTNVKQTLKDLKNEIYK